MLPLSLSLLFAVSLGSVPAAHAAPLIEVSATEAELYPDEPVERIQDRAREAALRNVPARHVPVSSWAYSLKCRPCRAYCDFSCKVTARALYVAQDGQDEDWTLERTGTHIEWSAKDTPTDGEREFAFAHQDAARQVAWACGSRQVFALPQSRTRIDDLRTYGRLSTYRVVLSAVCRAPTRGHRP